MDFNVSMDERIIEAVNSYQDEMIQSILELTAWKGKRPKTLLLAKA